MNADTNIALLKLVYCRRCTQVSDVEQGYLAISFCYVGQNGKILTIVNIIICIDTHIQEY